MKPNYPVNCWYVAARSDEVGRGLLGRRLLDRPVVLFRQESGEVVALEDRCAHRAYPLSKGRLDGDNLICGYHGFAYDKAGVCVRVPSQPNPPYDVGVHAFPVRDKAPFVWIWLGDPGSSVLSSPPDLAWLREGWASSGTTLHVAANFMLVHEHYLDITHILEMHPEETPPGLDELGLLDEVNVSETSVSFNRALPPAPLADWEADATGLPRDRTYSRRYRGTFISPAVVAEGWEIDGGQGTFYEQTRIQAVTPETTATTHLFWQLARNYATDRALIGRHLQAVFEPIMRQDIAVLEDIEAHAGYEAVERGARVSADAGVLKARSIVANMLAREGGRLAASARFTSGRRA
jgi:vanillate O-demethylase monooxygenase subunit